MLMKSLRHGCLNSLLYTAIDTLNDNNKINKPFNVIIYCHIITFYQKRVGSLMHFGFNSGSKTKRDNLFVKVYKQY